MIDAQDIYREIKHTTNTVNQIRTVLTFLKLNSIISLFIVKGPEVCTAEDEKICDVNSNCIKTNNNVKCVCKSGWTGNGYTCTGQPSLF